MTLTQYVAYDILPVVGDTGVAEILRNSPRSTEWTPVLTGPIATLSEPAAADTEILYNLTSNPCRPEGVAQGDVDWDWQGGACDNTWYTATQIADATVVPGGWSAVKSFKVLAFQATSPAAQWLGGRADHPQRSDAGPAGRS